MSYQVATGDPVIVIDAVAFERAAAVALKANGVTSQAQLDGIIANLTVANNPGMSLAACIGEQVLLRFIKMTP